MRNIIIVFVFSLFLSFSSFASESDSSCSLYNAKYKPHPSYHEENGKLSFVMTVKKPESGEGSGVLRRNFFYIDAHNNMNQEKVSSMRLGDSCSNGIVTCWIGAYEGQFGLRSDMKEFGSSINFKLIALDRDFFRVNHDSLMAPYIYILPDTASAIYYQIRGKSGENIEKFVQYYTEEKTFPDFSGYDVWVLNSCDVGGK